MYQKPHPPPNGSEASGSTATRPSTETDNERASQRASERPTTGTIEERADLEALYEADLSMLLVEAAGVKKRKTIEMITALRGSRPYVRWVLNGMPGARSARRQAVVRTMVHNDELAEELDVRRGCAMEQGRKRRLGITLAIFCVNAMIVKKLIDFSMAAPDTHNV
ncbi:hypothetical protein CCHR01_14340 [Colletotrichum chrysophilum]|uniref:Uncharacterized protein n=1 Tax=Colletotrichum chrysophilum TaxID=1836956 RepID=A0AAD9A8R6_9PEZI|nr:hypothetical protein CCHR01_14340 [Colletotrichum chrysophilum]